MIELSKQSARRLRHGLLTVILILGGIPIVMPLVWLVLSSLKTADRVLTEEPQWLPLVERFTVADENGQCAVTVVERGRVDTLGWWRVRPAYVPDHDWFYWPADRIDAIEVTGQVARIGGVMRTVARPTPVDQPGMVRVEQLGTQRVVEVRPGQLTSKSRRVLRILDQEVLFESLAHSAESVAGDDPQFRAVPIRITQASTPFLLADARMVGVRRTRRSDATVGWRIAVEAWAAWNCRSKSSSGTRRPASAAYASCPARRSASILRTWTPDSKRS